jgi:hypothetical protein
MVFGQYKKESEPKSIRAHFDTKLREVSKILVNIPLPKIDSLQQACSITITTPVSIVLASECPLTDSNILW